MHERACVCVCIRNVFYLICIDTAVILLQLGSPLNGLEQAIIYMHIVVTLPPTTQLRSNGNQLLLLLL